MTTLAISTKFDLQQHSGARHGILLLTAFLITFLITRFWVRMQRSGPAWWPNSLQAGGTHVHHLVPGIFILLICGFLGLITGTDARFYDLIAIGFGIGAALTLDEFALWLHLDDVYWAEEGRYSVDVIVIAFALGVLIVLGLTPFGIGHEIGTPFWLLIALIAADFTAVIICALKGKLYMAGLGIFVPGVRWIGAIRAARPGSWWAAKRYADRPEVAERGRIASERWSARRTRWWDAIGGRHGDEHA